MTHPTHADSEVRDVVIAMIREIAGHRGQISEKTRLFHDLSISGDDADELLTRVQERFGTSLSGMNFDELFPNETEGIFYRWGRFLWFGRTKKEFSLGHLLRVIKEGCWVDPEA
jgi:hypothetical protein